MRFWLMTIIMLFSVNTLAQKNVKKKAPSNAAPLSVDVDELEKEDRDRTGERSLRHLIYFPNAGDFFVSLGGSYFESKSETLNSAGARLSKSNTQGKHFDLGFQYGLLDFLAISFTTNFGDSERVREPVGTVKETYHAKGMGGSNFGLVYRPIRQSASWPFDLTFGLFYQPKLETAKTATTTADGTRGDERDIISIAGYLGYVGDFLEINASIGYAPGGQGESVDATTGLKTTNSSYNVTSLELMAQLPIMKWMFIDGKIGYTMADAMNSTTQTSTTTTVTNYFDGSNSYSYGGGAKFMIQPEMTSLRFGINYTTADDYNYRTSAGATGKISASSGMSYSLTLEHVF